MYFFRKNFFLLLVYSLLSLSWPLKANKLLTLSQAVREALEANPQLKSMEASVEAAKVKVGIARSLEEPMAGVEFEEVPTRTTDITQGMMTNYEISQKLPFPSKLVTQGKVAKKSYLAQKSFYAAGKINLQVETEHAFHHLYLLERTLRVNKELQGLFQKLSGSEKAKYQTGNNTSQNFLKASVELEKLKSEAELLEARRIEALTQLNILRNKDPKEEIYLAELPQHLKPVPDYDILEKRLFEKNPELAAGQFQVEASKANVSLARQEAWIPDLQAKFAYNQRYGREDAWTAGAMINIPFLWGKKRKEVKEAKAMRQAEEYAFNNLQNESLAMLKQAYAQFESVKRSHELFQQKILPNAQLALKSAEAAYQTGKDDFLSLMDAARGFKEVKLSALEAFVDYHKAASHLKMAVGEDFTKEVL